jgi:hypothetical protein
MKAESPLTETGLRCVTRPRQVSSSFHSLAHLSHSTSVSQISTAAMGHEGHLRVAEEGLVAFTFVVHKARGVFLVDEGYGRHPIVDH